MNFDPHVRSIELREWETSPSIPLAREEVRAINRVAVSRDGGRGRARFVEVLAGLDVGEYRLRASSYVGVLRAGPLQIVVRPKVGDAKALYLAAVAHGLEPRDEIVGLVSDEDLLEVLVPLVISSVERLMRSGLREEYTLFTDDLPVLRGRIDFAKQLSTRPGVPLPLAVRFEELSLDTPANRLFRAALDLIVDRHLGTSKDQNKAREILRGFDGVAPTPGTVSRDVEAPAPEYVDPIILSKLLLSGHSVDLFAGAVKVDGLVFDMNDVFQDFVFVGLRRRLEQARLGRLIAESRGVQLDLDVDGIVTLEPDFALWRQDRCVLVGDVKYKDLDTRKLPNADVYQVLAYAVGAGLSSAMLVYAGSGPAMELVVPHVGVEVRIFNLDLRRQFHEIEQQLDEVAASAVALAGAPHSV